MNNPLNYFRSDTAKLQARIDGLETALTSFKTDGLQNVLTNLGVFGKGRTPSTSFNCPNLLTAETLNNIYRGDGFGKKIVDIYANEMTRQWITLLNDPNDKMLNYLKNIKAKSSINAAIKWSRLYGGAVIFMMVDDGQEWDKPININTVRSIDKLAVYDRTQITVQQYYSDVSQRKTYNEPELYSIQQNIKATSGFQGTNLIIHESRILRFDGDLLPNSIASAQFGWGDSVLQGCYNQLINMLQSFDYGSELLHDFVVSVIKIAGMANLLLTPKGDAKIQKRLNLTAQTRSINNIVVLDKDDEYDKKMSAIGGLSELIDKFISALSAVTGIPQLVLMGESPSGLAATGDNNIRNWYDSIKSEQEEILTDPINCLLEVIKLARDSGVNKASEVNFVFNPLWQHTVQEIVTTQYTKAQTDQIYIQNGVYSPDAAREHLIAGKDRFEPEILEKNKDPSYSDISQAEDVPEVIPEVIPEGENAEEENGEDKENDDGK